MPGSLTRSLSRRLGVDATTAMRIALLYGDMEWCAAGASQVRYSARDYARRQGLSRNTVLADLQRLQRIGAVSLQMEACAALALYGLHGLHADQQDPAVADGEVAQRLRHPGSNHEPPGSRRQLPGLAHEPPCSEQEPTGSTVEPPPGSWHEPPGSIIQPPLGSAHAPPPGSRDEPPLAQALSHPWLTASATLEKSLKEEQKEERKADGQPNQPPPRTGSALVSSHDRDQAQPKGGVEPFAMSSGSLHGEAPRAGSPVLEQEHRHGQDRSQTSTTSSGLPTVSGGRHRPIEHPSRAQPVSPSRPSLPREAPPEREGGASQTGGHTSGHAPGNASALLARLLTAYRAAKPAEWPAPSALSLRPARKGKLQAALRYAGSQEALEQRLKAALAHVPPWYRNTYPVRPDGSPRPAHQFFDVLFRATGDERDGGLEAWHLFAWSEAGSRGSAGRHGAGQGVGQGVAVAGSSEPAQETDLERARRLFVWDTPNWRMRAIEAYSLSLAERRRLTGLLEDEGEAYPGAGAFEFADPPEPAPADGANSAQEPPKDPAFPHRATSRVFPREDPPRGTQRPQAQPTADPASQSGVLPSWPAPPAASPPDPTPTIS